GGAGREGGKVKGGAAGGIRKNPVGGRGKKLPKGAGGGRAVELILVYARRLKSPGTLQRATRSVVARRCDLFETSGKIAKMGQPTVPIGGFLLRSHLRKNSVRSSNVGGRLAWAWSDPAALWP